MIRLAETLKGKRTIVIGQSVEMISLLMQIAEPSDELDTRAVRFRSGISDYERPTAQQLWRSFMAPGSLSSLVGDRWIPVEMVANGRLRDDLAHAEIVLLSLADRHFRYRFLDFMSEINPHVVILSCELPRNPDDEPFGWLYDWDLYFSKCHLLHYTWRRGADNAYRDWSIYTFERQAMIDHRARFNLVAHSEDWPDHPYRLALPELLTLRWMEEAGGNATLSQCYLKDDLPFAGAGQLVGDLGWNRWEHILNALAETSLVKFDAATKQFRLTLNGKCLLARINPEILDYGLMEIIVIARTYGFPCVLRELDALYRRVESAQREYEGVLAARAAARRGMSTASTGTISGNEIEDPVDIPADPEYGNANGTANRRRM